MLLSDSHHLEANTVPYFVREPRPVSLTSDIIVPVLCAFELYLDGRRNGTLCP